MTRLDDWSGVTRERLVGRSPAGYASGNRDLVPALAQGGGAALAAAAQTQRTAEAHEAQRKRRQAPTAAQSGVNGQHVNQEISTFERLAHELAIE